LRDLTQEVREHPHRADLLVGFYEANREVLDAARLLCGADPPVCSRPPGRLLEANRIV